MLLVLFWKCIGDGDLVFRMRFCCLHRGSSHNHLGWANDALTQCIAGADDVYNRSLWQIGMRFGQNGFVLFGVELLSRGTNLAHSHMLEGCCEPPCHQMNALDPGLLGHL